MVEDEDGIPQIEDSVIVRVCSVQTPGRPATAVQVIEEELRIGQVESAATVGITAAEEPDVALVRRAVAVPVGARRGEGVA